MPRDSVANIARKLIEHYGEHGLVEELEKNIARALLRERDPRAYVMTLDFNDPPQGTD